MKYRTPIEWVRFNPQDFKNYAMPRTNGQVERAKDALVRSIPDLGEMGAYELLLKIGSYLNERAKR